VLSQWRGIDVEGGPSGSVAAVSWRRSANSVVSAGAIGTSLSLLNIMVGLVFQAALAATLGVDSLADTFQVAWTVVTFAAVVQFTIVLSLLVPRLQLVEDGSSSATGSRLPLFLGSAASVIQAGIAVAVTSGDLKVLLVTTAPAHLFVGASAVPQALSYISRRFWVVGAGPIANGAAMLVVVLVRIENLDPATLGIGVTTGYMAQWGVTLLGTRDLLPTRSAPPAVSVRLFLGVVGFTLVSKFQPVLERIIAYQLATGTTAALGYAQKVTQGLLVFAAFGFATASTASLAHYTRQKELNAVAELLGRVTLVTVLFGSVVCALALPAAYPMVVMLFRRGAFTDNDAVFVANIVIAQLPWIWAGALAGVISSYLYVVQKFFQLLFVGLASLSATLACSLLLDGVTPKFAVAIASSVGMWVSLLAAFLVLMRTELFHLYWSSLKRHWRLVLASMAVLGSSLLFFVLLHFWRDDPTFSDHLMATSATGVAAVVVLLRNGSARTELRQVVSSKF
jgi:putative peptidoglycan lipid II flippase